MPLDLPFRGLQCPFSDNEIACMVHNSSYICCIFRFCPSSDLTKCGLNMMNKAEIFTAPIYIATMLLFLQSCILYLTEARSTIQHNALVDYGPGPPHKQDKYHREPRVSQYVKQEQNTSLSDFKINSKSTHSNLHNKTSDIISKLRYVKRIFSIPLIFNLNSNIICRSDTFLVIVVCSSAEHFSHRAAIRKSWASPYKDLSSRTKVVFLIGLPNQSEYHEHARDIQDMIIKEAYEYQDIIQADFEDSYKNLSLKSIAMLQWMDVYCNWSKFLLKTDDDVFIHVKVLLEDLQQLFHNRFIMGNIISGAQPIQDRTSKWFTPKSVYSHDRYPNYISGTAYVVSGDLIHDLYIATLKTDIFIWEDVYITGICAKQVNATHIFNAKFGYKKRILDPCLFQLLITGHHMNPDDQLWLWKNINNPRVICPTEK